VYVVNQPQAFRIAMTYSFDYDGIPDDFETGRAGQLHIQR
jgi:hypothetical protein